MKKNAHNKKSHFNSKRISLNWKCYYRKSRIYLKLSQYSLKRFLFMKQKSFVVNKSNFLSILLWKLYGLRGDCGIEFEIFMTNTWKISKKCFSSNDSSVCHEQVFWIVIVWRVFYHYSWVVYQVFFFVMLKRHLATEKRNINFKSDDIHSSSIGLYFSFTS